MVMFTEKNIFLNRFSVENKFEFIKIDTKAALSG